VQGVGSAAEGSYWEEVSKSRNLLPPLDWRDKAQRLALPDPGEDRTGTCGVETSDESKPLSEMSPRWA
jgi:hypothetical protein